MRVAACVAAVILTGSLAPSTGWADIIIDGRQAQNPYTLNNHQELDAGYEIVGATSPGIFNHLGGENELRGTLTIGDTPTGIGTYTFNSGDLSSANTIVGNAGTATFTQNGGSHEIGKGGSLTIGSAAGSTGTYNLNAGELTVGVLSIGVAGTGTFTLNAGSLSAGNARIGVAAAGTGTFNHYGGTVSVSNTLTLGGPLEGAGSYNLGNPIPSSGPAPVLTAGNETIGDNGSGSFTHLAGSNRVAGTLLIGNSGTGGGIYELDGGTLIATAEIVGNAGFGNFIQNGGANQVGHGSLIVGNLNGGFGAYFLTDGTLTAGSLTVALAAPGRFFQIGGTVLLDKGLTVGAVSTFRLNQYFLVGGSLQAGGNETIGDVGSGRFQHSAGTNTISGGGLVLGNQSSGIGSYFISGDPSNPSILTADFATVGQAGTGQFYQLSGGSVTLGGGHDEPDNQGPNGDFHFDGHNAALVLGNAPTGNGSYALLDGTLMIAGKGVEIIGNAGTGNFTQESGTHQVTGLLVLGGAAGGNGTYTLSGGTLTLSGLPTDPDATSTLVVGADGTGTFNLNGGTASVAGSVIVGGGSGPGFLNVSGGTLTSGSGFIGDDERSQGTVTVTAPGTWTVSAGNLVVGEQGQGLMTVSQGGVVTTSGSNWVIIGDQNHSIGVVTVTDPGSQLNVGGFLMVGDKGLGTLNVLNGGVVTALGTLPLSGHGDDDVPLAPITIGRSGTVAGNGTLNGNVLNFGTVRPQTVGPTGPGTLSVNGSYTQALTGTLAIEVAPASGASSRLTVTGPAALAGTLALAFDPGPYVQGSSYILLTGNTVSGRFGQVTQTGNIGLLQPKVTYTALEVDMTLVMAPLQSFAATPNQFGVASSLQQAAGSATGGSLLTVVNALVRNSPSQAQTAFTAMAGTPYASLPAVAADTLHAAAAGVFGHWDGSGMALAGTRFLPGNAAGGNGLLSTSLGARGTTAFQLGGTGGNADGLLGTPGMGFWAQGFNGYAISGSGDPTGSSANAQTTGLLMGRDFSLSPNLQIGTTFGSWQSGASMSDAAGQSAGLTTGLVATYGRYTSGDWTVDALAGYTFDTVSVSRPIAFIGRTATANYTTNDMIASLQVSRQMQWGGVTVAPGLGLDYVQSTLPTVTESGADSLDLTLAGGTVTSLRGIVGVRFTSPADTRNFGWTAYAGYAHEFGATAFTTTATLAGAPDAPFGVTTVTAADSWSAGVGFNWHLWDGANLHVNYNALLSTVQINQTGSVGLDLHF